jgi:hypothetical protein
MRHGRKKLFSCEGIRLCLDYWSLKGHKVGNMRGTFREH